MLRRVTPRRMMPAIAAAAAIVSLALAASSHAAVVVLTEAEIAPRTATVAAGDSVTWQNEGTAEQRVESEGRPSFEPLVVAPGQEASRRFAVPGRYRYRAAGGDAIVQVVGIGGRFARATGRGCERRSVHRYEIRVDGRKTVAEQWLPGFAQSGSFSIAYRYRARFREVPLAVERGCGRGTRLELPGGRLRRHPGSASLTSYAWSDSVQFPGDRRPPACGFTLARAGLGAAIERTDGFIAPGSRGSSMFFTAALTADQSEVLSTLLGNRRDAQCDKDPSFRNASVFDGLPGYDTSSQRGSAFSAPFPAGGLKLDPPSLLLNGSFNAFTRRGAARAVAQLSRGRSVSVRSGVRRLDDTSTQTRAVGRAQVTIEFVRRR